MLVLLTTKLWFSDIIVEKKLDILCLVETWHKQSDGLLFNELTPAGYGLFDLPRSSGRGGGIIVLYNQQYSLSPVAAPLFNSFECLVLTISESFSTAIVIVYRPPKANKDFLSEFAELLSFLCLKFERTLIQGDFNIHMDKKDSTLTKYFLSLLECFDLNQFVDCFTHNKGHILDLVISSGSLVSQLSTVDLGLSDHLAIIFDLYLPGAYISSSRIMTYRKWRSIELSDFSVFIDSSLSSFSSFDPLETKVSMIKFCSLVWPGYFCSSKVTLCFICTSCSLV